MRRVIEVASLVVLLLVGQPLRLYTGDPIKVDAKMIFDHAPFESCHASTIVESASGQLLAAWFGGTGEGQADVGIWLSRRTDRGWTAPVEVARGTSPAGADGKLVRHPAWNPVLFQPKEQPLTLFFKVGPSPSEWWGMVMTSGDGKTWSAPQRLPERILGPIKNKPIQLDDGTIVSPSSSEDRGWRVHCERSADGGKTWKLIGPIADGKKLGAIQPSLLQHEGGKLQMLCRSTRGVIAESWSLDRGLTWSELNATNLLNPNSGIDAVTLDDGRHLLVYNPTATDRTPLVVALSNDGSSWTDVRILENQPGEYSYPAVIQAADGLVHITYTHRRERIAHVVLDPESL